MSTRDDLIKAAKNAGLEVADDLKLEQLLAEQNKGKRYIANDSEVVDPYASINAEYKRYHRKY